MFRCPCCGQAQEMPTADDPVHGPGYQFLINADKDKNGFGLDRTYLAHKNDENHLWQLVTDEMIPSILEQLPENTSCPRCNEPSATGFWFDCWEDPLRSPHLETENLCHCGGELWLEEIPKVSPKKFGWVCEKCEWVKPNATLSAGSSGLL